MSALDSTIRDIAISVAVARKLKDPATASTPVTPVEEQAAKKRAILIVKLITTAIMNQKLSPIVADEEVRNFVDSCRDSAGKLHLRDLSDKLFNYTRDTHVRDVSANSPLAGRIKQYMNKQIRELCAFGDPLLVQATTPVIPAPPKVITSSIGRDLTPLKDDLAAAIMGQMPGMRDPKSAHALAGRIIDLSIELLMQDGLSPQDATKRVSGFIRVNHQRGSNEIDISLVQDFMLKRTNKIYNAQCDDDGQKALGNYNVNIRKIADLGLSALLPPLTQLQSISLQGRVSEPNRAKQTG
jgi:hypothetical protein